MSFKQKMIALALLPLLLAVGAIALALAYQSRLLAEAQNATIDAAWQQSKRAELHHYVELAQNAIAPLLASGRTDADVQAQAKRILASLTFGEDGYFFVYDMHGKNLMHPRQPELEGRDLWNLRDADGNPTIQRLIARAAAGGGFEPYQWVKPSTGKTVAKLGYVVPLPAWGWMMGTGLYLDDVEQTLRQVRAQQTERIQATMLLVAGIAIFGALLVGGSGLALTISEQRLADARLRALADRVVESQEAERMRLSRDLHDAVGQQLVSIKLKLEAASLRLQGDEAMRNSATPLLDGCTGQLATVMDDIRRLSHALRPALLDDLGLEAALAHLAKEANVVSPPAVHAEVQGTAWPLPEAANTALFRVAQEALANCQRHARAASVSLHLAWNDDSVCLSIVDDGHGFDPEAVAKLPDHGLGLDNMRKRIETLGGRFAISSGAHGTRIDAILERA